MQYCQCTVLDLGGRAGCFCRAYFWLKLARNRSESTLFPTCSSMCCSVAPIMYRCIDYRHNFASIGIGFHRSDTTDIHVALTVHAHAIYQVVLTRLQTSCVLMVVVLNCFDIFQPNFYTIQCTKCALLSANIKAIRVTNPKL